MSGGSHALNQQLNTLSPSVEAVAAILWGATRKHHANDLRDENEVMELLDEADDLYGDDERAYNENVGFPLISVYTRMTERNLMAMYDGADINELPDPMPGGNRESRRSKKNGSSANGSSKEKKGPTKVEESQEAQAS